MSKRAIFGTFARMRIHIQNLPGTDEFDITQAQWDAAVARAGASGHAVSIANTPEGFAEAMLEAEAVIVIPGLLGRLLPLNAPKLRIVFTPAAGVEKLTPFDWLPPGCLLVNNSGTHGAKAAEFALMSILMLATRMPVFATQQRAQVWKSLFTPTLKGQRLTVIGTGDLGSAAAASARKFGMVVTGVRTRAEPLPEFDRMVAVDALDSVLPKTDILVIATPLTPATTNLMDRRRLSLLPQGAGLLNIGRGAVLDDVALCDLLDAGHLSGAIVDVTVPEPLPPGHRMWTTPNLVIVPHCSVDNPLTYNDDSLDIFFRNLAAMDAGQEMPNLVDLTRGY